MKKKKRPFLAVLVPALLISAALIAAYTLILNRDIGVIPQRPETGRSPVQDGKVLSKDAGPPPKSAQQPSEKASRPASPKVGIIIDDLGYHRDLDLQLIRLDLPLSFAILPSAPFTEVVAREASRRGREILLHQPMEPKDYPCVQPGPGALLLSMDENQIRETIHHNLRQVPGARGMNNHMGSSFTENREKMSMVLRELRELGLFYVDSRTTNGTIGAEAAKKMGVPSAERTIFLDNDPHQEAISKQMGCLVRAARTSGFAIGIGHPYPETLDILRKLKYRLEREVSIVRVSELVR